MQDNCEKQSKKEKICDASAADNKNKVRDYKDKWIKEFVILCV